MGSARYRRKHRFLQEAVKARGRLYSMLILRSPFDDPLIFCSSFFSSGASTTFVATAFTWSLCSCVSQTLLSFVGTVRTVRNRFLAPFAENDFELLLARRTFLRKEAISVGGETYLQYRSPLVSYYFVTSQEDGNPQPDVPQKGISFFYVNPLSIPTSLLGRSDDSTSEALRAGVSQRRSPEQCFVHLRIGRCPT